eukprot:scaffold84078_cov48-Phaeocystis_antarctica.AAC.3
MSAGGRRLPLRRSRNAKRRLLGGGEAAQLDYLATALHLRLVGFGIAGTGDVDAKVARLVFDLDQRQTLRLRLLPHFLARQRRRRCSPLRRRHPLRRSRNAQRRLLGGGKVAQGRCLATAPHPHRIGLELAAQVQGHAEVARLVVGLEQRQPLRLRMLPRLLARERRYCCGPLHRRLPLRRPRDAQRRLLGSGEAAQLH